MTRDELAGAALAVVISVAVFMGAFAVVFVLNIIVVGQLWGWFVTPVFGVPVPPWPAIVGLTLLTSWLTTGGYPRDGDADPGVRFWALVAALAFRVAFTLVVGYWAATLLGTA